MSHSRISKRISAIAESATLKVDSKAKALIANGRPVISYAAGEPDFPTPAHIVEAAAIAVRDPKNHRYTPAAGLPEMKEAIVQKTLEDSGTKITPSQVIVTNGGKQAVYQAFQVILDDGDEVLVPAPYWTTYPEAIKLAGGKQVDVFAGSDQGYKVTVEHSSLLDLLLVEIDLSVAESEHCRLKLLDILHAHNKHSIFLIELGLVQKVDF